MPNQIVLGTPALCAPTWTYSGLEGGATPSRAPVLFWPKLGGFVSEGKGVSNAGVPYGRDIIVIPPDQYLWRSRLVSVGNRAGLSDTGRLAAWGRRTPQLQSRGA